MHQGLILKIELSERYNLDLIVPVFLIILAELLIFWGADQETTPWGWQGQLPSRLSFW